MFVVAYIQSIYFTTNSSKGLPRRDAFVLREFAPRLARQVRESDRNEGGRRRVTLSQFRLCRAPQVCSGENVDGVHRRLSVMPTPRRRLRPNPSLWSQWPDRSPFASALAASCECNRRGSIHDGIAIGKDRGRFTHHSDRNKIRNRAL